MNYQEIYVKLKALQNKAFNLTDSDKEYIRLMSVAFTIDFVERPNCKKCFATQILFLLDACEKNLVVVNNSNCDYEVLNGKDVVIRTKRINKHTITNELAEWLINYYPNHSKYIKRK